MQEQQKRRKFYTKHGASSFKSSCLIQPGDNGFLCTFNDYEYGCARDATYLLNTYADKLFGNDYKKPPNEVPPGSDIEEILKKEVQELLSRPSRFENVKTGAKNVLFVRTSIADPVGFVIAIIEDFRNTKRIWGRSLIRLIPIEITCKAYVDDIKKACSTLLEKHFKDNDKSFAIAYNRRNNSQIDRDEVITEVANLVAQVSGNHTVNLTKPDVTIIIEVVKKIACLSVVPNYTTMKKFNLHALASDEVKDTTSNEEIENANESSKVATDV